jgi:sporulation-control protein spo0M
VEEEQDEKGGRFHRMLDELKIILTLGKEGLKAEG